MNVTKRIKMNKKGTRTKSSCITWSNDNVPGSTTSNRSTSTTSHGRMTSTTCGSLGLRDHKWIFLLLFFSLNVEPSLSSSSCPLPPRLTFGNVVVQDSPYNGVYSNGSRAILSCRPGFRLRSEPAMYCFNGDWVTLDRSPPKCDEIKGDDHKKCESPPEISHGYYHLPHEENHSVSGEKMDSYPIGTELQATCESSFSLNCPNQRCGRITCDSDGTWAPTDGQLITSCAAVPLTVVSGNTRDIRPADDDDRMKSQSTQNYLVLALAIVCIVGVGALTVALVRRPLFCKKGEQSQNEQPVMCQSSSPHHARGDDLDSIPVAMNTGIFIPGADYDLQDYHLQDGTFVGTTVFK